MKDKSEISIAPTDMCFGCGASNPCGVKLRFDWDGKTATSGFTPSEIYQGWEDIIHGGILTTLLDEAMAYAAYFGNVPGVTATMEIKFRRPVRVGQHLNITAWIIRKERRFAETGAKLTLDDGTVVTEAKATQYMTRKGYSF
jgi:acyl-coenzyme A thioesterase PaaI-like protein